VVDALQGHVRPPSCPGRPPSDVDPEEALARLAARYLTGHGPATARDLAAWAGVPLGTARRAFALVAEQVVPFDRDGDPDLVDLRDRERPAPLPPPRLLGPFDPLLHGWRDRSPVVGRQRQVVTTNGLFRASALVDGRVVGTWRLSGGVVTIEPLEPVPERDLAALHQDAADVLRFLGLTR
jgi:hypothetical protein